MSYGLFDEINVYDVVGHYRHLVTVSFFDTVKDALEKLKTNQVVAAVVIDDNGQYVGMVDTVDLVCHVVSVSSILHESKHTSIQCKRFLESLMFSEDNVASVYHSQGATPKVFVDDKISKVIRKFGDAHRAIVLDHSHHLVNVISQSDIVSFVAKHNLPTLKCLLEVPVLELTLRLEKRLSKEVFSINGAESLLNALKLVISKKVNGVAVVDDEKKTSWQFQCFRYQSFNRF